MALNNKFQNQSFLIIQKNKNPQDEYDIIEPPPEGMLILKSFIPIGSRSSLSNLQLQNQLLTFKLILARDYNQKYYEDKLRNYSPSTENDARNADTFLV